jgi:hypothetical protein
MFPPSFRLIPALLGAFLLTLSTIGLVGLPCRAADAPSPAAGRKTTSQPAPDTLIFGNGDRLSGRLLRTVGDTVYFHNEFVGDVAVKWDRVKELRTGTAVVLENSVFPEHGRMPANLPQVDAAIRVADVPSGHAW